MAATATAEKKSRTKAKATKPKAAKIATDADGKPKGKGAVRIMRYEIVHLGDKPTVQAVRQRWFEASNRVQQAINTIHERWLVWHVLNGSANKMRDHLDADKKWRETKQGERPKWPVQCVTPELQKEIYKELCESFGDLSSRVRVLLQQAVLKKLSQRKAARGNLPGWVAILFHNESLPSSTRPQPIPFDCDNVQEQRPMPPLTNDGHWRLGVRISRVEPQDGKKNGSSPVDDVELWTKGRKCIGPRKILTKIEAGELKFCGSSLLFDRGKWYALVAYQRLVDDSRKATGELTAVLRPGMYGPWRLRIGGRTMRLHGDGRYVSEIRRRLWNQRRSRNDNYRHAGGSVKGHGRNRATIATTKLMQRWRDFVSTDNHQLTSKVLKICGELGVDRLIYCQPKDEMRDERFLVRAGNDGTNTRSGWDWYQVATRLRYKSQPLGIEVIEREMGGKAETRAARNV